MDATEAYNQGVIDSGTILADIERSRTLEPERLRLLARGWNESAALNAERDEIVKGQYAAGRAAFYRDEANRREQAPQDETGS